VTKHGKELAIGLLVLTAVILLTVLVLFFGETGNMFVRTYPVTATFANAGGIRPGVPVRLAGVDIGAVKSVTLVSVQQARAEGRPGPYVEVALAIRQAYVIPQDSELWLEEHLMLGEKYLEFNVVGQSSQDLPTDGTARVAGLAHQSPVDFMQQLSDELARTTSEFTKTLTVIQELIGTPETKKNLQSVAANAAEIASTGVAVAKELEKTVVKARELTDKLDRLVGTVNERVKLLSDDATRATKYIEENAARVQAILTSLENVLCKGQGSLGQWTTSDKLNNNALDALAKLDETLASARESFAELAAAAKSAGALAEQLREHPSQVVWGKRTKRSRRPTPGPESPWERFHRP